MTNITQNVTQTIPDTPLTIIDKLNYLVLTSFDYTKEILIPTVWERTKELIFAPRNYPEMIWIVTPMLITLVLMEFYFGRYSKEELGWNTAVGNSMVLIFVAVDLFRYLFGRPEEFVELTGMALSFSIKAVVAGVIGLYGLILLMSNFFHIIPKKFSFFISSGLPINLTAYMGIAAVYANIKVDFFTILGAIFIFIVLKLFFGIIHFIEPKAGLKPKITEDQLGIVEKQIQGLEKRITKDEKEVKKVEKKVENGEKEIKPKKNNSNSKK